MPDPAAQVKINALLMQREAAFVRIWEIEQRLQQILGQPFPLTIPVDLPSRQPPRKAGAKARQADARPRIRSLLREGETAWLITYRHRGEVHQRLETSADTIRDLAGIDTPFLHILRIDTVRVTDAGNETVETLYERA
jgi:hypothetical protein